MKGVSRTFAKLKVNNANNIIAHIDSGCEMSILSKAYFDSLNSQAKIFQVSQVLDTFGGKEETVTKAVELQIKLEGQSKWTTVKFLITEFTKQKFSTIGQDILRNMKADLDMATWNTESCQLWTTNKENVTIASPIYTNQGTQDAQHISAANEFHTYKKVRYSAPYARIGIQDTNITCFVDTGASDSSISISTVRKHKWTNLIKKSSVQQLFGISIGVEVLGSIRLKIILHNQQTNEPKEFYHTFQVIDTKINEVSLSLPFFTENKLVHSSSMNCISGPNQTRLNYYKYPRDKNVNSNNKLTNRDIEQVNKKQETQQLQSPVQSAHLIITNKRLENTIKTNNKTSNNQPDNTMHKTPQSTTKQTNIEINKSERNNNNKTETPDTMNKSPESIIEPTNTEINKSEREDNNKTETTDTQVIKTDKTIINQPNQTSQKSEMSPEVEQTYNHNHTINQIKNAGPTSQQTEKLSHIPDEYISTIKPGNPTITHNPLSHNDDKTDDNQINIQPHIKCNEVTHIPHIDKEPPATITPVSHPVKEEINELEICNQYRRSNHITIPIHNKTVNKPEITQNPVSKETSTSTNTTYETIQEQISKQPPATNTHTEATPTKQQPRPPEECKTKKPGTRNNIYPQQDNTLTQHETNNNAELKNQYNPSLQNIQETDEETKENTPTADTPQTDTTPSMHKSTLTYISDETHQLTLPTDRNTTDQPTETASSSQSQPLYIDPQPNRN